MPSAEGRRLLASAQGGVDAVQQGILRERLGEKAESSRLDGASFCPLFGEGRHENDGYLVTGGNEPILQIDAAHPGHPDVGNDTRNILRAARVQKLFRR